MSRTIVALTATLIATPAFAVDGVIEINHAQVLSGGITPGDKSGYPATLSVPGSYRLTGALVQPNTTTVAILITAHQVSVDLNGFAVHGPCYSSAGPSCTGAASACIQSSFGIVGSVVKNGTVAGCGGNGLTLGDECRVTNIAANANVGTGISVGEYCVVRDAEIGISLGTGLSIGDYGLVSGISARRNLRHGILIGVGTNLSHSVASQNGQSGVTGFGFATRVTALSNGEYGLNLTEGTVQQSHTRGNVLGGIEGASVHSCRMVEFNPLGPTAISVDGNICHSTPCP